MLIVLSTLTLFFTKTYAIIFERWEIYMNQDLYELYEELCDKLEVPKHCECHVEERDCLLSLGYGAGEMSCFCATDSIPSECIYRAKEPMYTPFTMKKQLELIKFLIRQENIIINYIYTNSEYGISCTDFEHNEIFVKEYNFTEALLALLLKIVNYNEALINKKELILILEKGSTRA